MHADLFIAIHHDSVPDNLLQTWQYEGQEEHYNDDYPGYAIFISNDNPDRAGSLMFGGFLGKELQARGLQYTPHYTLPLMGHRRRELLDAEAGVYRYDQLIVLARNPHAGGAARSRLDRQSPGGIAIGKPRTPFAHQRGDRRRSRRFLRGPCATGCSAKTAHAGQACQSAPAAAHASAVWLFRNASAPMIMKLRILTPSPAAKAGA